MGKYIVRRLLQMIPVIIGTTFIIYAMVFALPVQYVKYLGKLVQGDLGTNQYEVPVREDLAQRFKVTGKLAIMALTFEVVLGISAGILAGIRKGRFIDNLVLVSTLVVISIPVFVIGALAQYFLGVRLGLFPVTVSSEATFYELMLPAMVLGSLSVAYVARLTRTNLAENLRADYVRTAGAKGLPRWRVVVRHTLRNSLIPVVTFLGVELGSLMAGAVVTEYVFNLPGIGQQVFQAIQLREGPTVVGITTALVLVYCLANLLVDVLYGLLDPRIRHDQ